MPPPHCRQPLDALALTHVKGHMSFNKPTVTVITRPAIANRRSALHAAVRWVDIWKSIYLGHVFAGG